MKKAKKEKKDTALKAEEPVSYNRSIMAAFEKQINGKTCPLCKVKFSLAAYKTHMNGCSVAENDEEIAVIASYSREEAVLMRAGPEIVLGEESLNEKSGYSKDSARIPEEISKTPEAPGNSVKRRRTEEQKEKENTPAPIPSTSKDPVCENVIKESPLWENRRRSAGLAKEAQKAGENSKSAGTVVKKETATVREVLTAIQNFDSRIEGVEHVWPYYMKYTLKIIKRVLSTQKSDGTFYADDFWTPDDITTLFRFVDQVSEAAKCLLCRLFIRKPAWHNLEKLRQKYPEIPDISQAAVELARWKFIEDDSSLKSLDDAIALADLSVLKNVAKKFKIDSCQNRVELVQSIRKFGQSQRSIFGGVGSVEQSLLRTLKQELGTCVRIQNDIIDLLKAFFTIYCPYTTNSVHAIENPSASNVHQELLYMMLSIDNGSVRFPAPNPCPNIVSFYKSREMLMDYTTAKSMETMLVTIMAGGALGTALDLAIDAKDFIKSMSAEQKAYYESLEVHERKFTAIWVLTRCFAHGATILEKQKKWGMAVEWHKDLLLSEDFKHYCLDSRGTWWDRLLLNLDSHLKERNECAKMIKLAMEDPSVLEKELLLIQDRALKLKGVDEDFRPKILIGQPETRTISAPTITKNLGDRRVNRFVIRDVDKEEDVEVSVEEVARIRYLDDEGFRNGLHDEGATWHTLFGILFYEVIFPDGSPETPSSTWLSEVQDSPIDLSNSLYSKRAAKFDDRFEWLEETENERIEEKIRRIWDLKKEETNRECSWKLFPGGVDECVDLFHCTPRQALIAIFRRLAENYRNCRSGFPDLTLWNRETKQVAVVEVKGPGDRLSTKQRLWLAFFAKHGVRAEVCHFYLRCRFI
ncbi:unnamed protein product [Caenorhabditis sp. 36 PRJEB53466]|nr:unnamed protein product [Caenorhabditis sp. 36 PRJEB53466]